MNTNNTYIISNLLELRARIIRILVMVLMVFLALSPFSNQIYKIIAIPLTTRMPLKSGMVAIDILSPFLTPIKFTLIFSFFITVPWIIYQIWLFISPGLYQTEKKLILPIVLSSIILFYMGTLFAYFIMMPIFFDFLIKTTPEGIMLMTDISHYLDFVIAIFFGFGIAFEVPVVTIILSIFGIISPDNMAKKRPYIIVGAFIIGMFLTPPDVVSQTLLAIPIWFLFELGLLVSRIIAKNNKSILE